MSREEKRGCAKTPKKKRLKTRRTVATMRAVAREDVYESMAFNALVHYRIKEHAIPTIARVVRAEDAAREMWTIRLAEFTTHVGEEGALKSAHRDNLADAFEVATEVVAFQRDQGAKAPLGEGVRRGIIRSVDTNQWPPVFVVKRTDDGEGTEIRVPGAQLALAKAYDDETRARERKRAMEEADLIAKELMEEERREREAAERAAKKKLAKKKNRSASDVSSVSTVGTVEYRDVDNDDGADDKAREEQERVAAEKAAAKAAARARQEEIKAEKLAKEKAAKKEAQKARKAAQREAEMLSAAVTSDKAEKTAPNKSITLEEEKEEEEKETSADVPSTSVKEGDEEHEVPVKTSDSAQDASSQKAPTMTETQRRKLEKQHRKEQRLAEIDAYLKAQEIVAEDEDENGGNGAGATNKSKKKKNAGKKKKKNGGKDSDLKLTAKSNTEWFAAFAVLSFFTLAGAIYYIFVNSYSVLRATTTTFS